MSYKHDLDIPGYASKERLDILAEHAAAVPKGGWIVEFGSFAGRTSYTLSENSHTSVKTTCIDCFVAAETFEQKIKTRGNILGKIIPGEKAILSVWQKYTKDCTNIDYLKAFFPIGTDEFIFARQADLIYFDADHRYHRVKEDMDYFYNKLLKVGGTIIIDDYNPKHFPGVVRAINEFCMENKLDMESIDGSGVKIVKCK